MRAKAFLRRLTILTLCGGLTASLSIPHATASIDAFNDLIKTVHSVTATASSMNDFTIVQEATEQAMQDADIDLEAATDLANIQISTPTINVDIQQTTCGDDPLCIQQAAPHIVAQAVQNLTASAANLLDVAQHADSGEQTTQFATTVRTSIDAQQVFQPTIVLKVAQDCAISIGACVQSAMPLVDTLASQILDAHAVNKVGVDQQMTEGGVQGAEGEFDAETAVHAEQIVTPKALVTLVQTCTLEKGLCVQNTLATVQHLAEQMVNAQTENAIALNQQGAEQQGAAVTGSSATIVQTLQDVVPETTIEQQVVCNVQQGLCIQSGDGTKPHYTFVDGHITEAGDYDGTMPDEHAFDDGFNRTTVTSVAMGICPSGQGLCPQVQKLLFWIFGPEPETAQTPAESSGSGGGGSGNHSVSRGHHTNVLAGMLRFLAEREQHTGNSITVDGGSVDIASADTDAITMLCSLRRSLLMKNQSVSEWTMEQIAETMGGAEDSLQQAWVDPTLCNGNAIVREENPLPPSLIAFPMDSTGPVSTNALWNDCVRGKLVTFDDVKANPDRNAWDRPSTCSDYSDATNEWIHPDLGIRFWWDSTAKALRIPDGYIAVYEAETVAAK